MSQSQGLDLSDVMRDAVSSNLGCCFDNWIEKICGLLKGLIAFGSFVDNLEVTLEGPSDTLPGGLLAGEHMLANA